MPLLLDLCCGAGGAAKGYADAGFDIIGVDIVEQPLYPFEFVRADAVTYSLDDVDAIHASPPCKGYSTMSNRHGSTAQRLIAVLRQRLRSTGLPYVIENVCGARPEMHSPIMLHGGHFGLDVWRPRLFESNVLLLEPARAKKPTNTVSVYGHHEQTTRRLWTRKDGTELHAATLIEARVAMQMPWADWVGVREAVPPAYTEWIGRQLISYC